MFDEGLMVIFKMITMKVCWYRSIGYEQMYNKTKTSYDVIVNLLKGDIKDIPINFLSELAMDTTFPSKDIDPELLKEGDMTIADIAKREIHRRAFVEFTRSQVQKPKMNISKLGYVRKPKD